MARRLRNEQGAAAVEFALILPILLVLVFGIVELARAYNAQVSLTGAAREGARTMAVEDDYAAAEAKVIAASALNSAPTVSIVPADCVAGQDVTVTATQDVAWNMIFVSGTFTARGQAVMRCGG